MSRNNGPMTDHEEGAIVMDMLQTCLIRIYMLPERGAERLLGLLAEMSIQEDEWVPVYEAVAALVNIEMAEMRSGRIRKNETQH